MAEQVAEVFTEVVVAPGYDDGAVEILAAKKNIRLLECGPLARGGAETRMISGGMLIQSRDAVDADRRRWRRPGQLDAGHRRARLTLDLADLAFAWKACRAVKSNAILLARAAPRSASAWAR